jgi:hypothetical protein
MGDPATSSSGSGARCQSGELAVLGMATHCQQPQTGDEQRSEAMMERSRRPQLQDGRPNDE